MFFDTLGQVRACCVNHTYALGHVAGQRLPDIWHGPAAQQLRDALARGDFSMGCEFCKWQVGDGTEQVAHARKYDPFPRSAPGALWPSNLEFNLSNTCNLECPMCDGELSSAIRARRDRLPPLPKVYGDQFFEDLRPFLPHARTMQFLGGEPFLVREHFRVWDLLIEDRLTPRCEITTNGTQYNAQVERVLEHLPVSINVSLDGATPATVAALRRNAQLDQVLTNFAKFHRYTRERGTAIGFNFSLMQQNWREFGEFLVLAEAWQTKVSICTVVHPARFSLYALPVAELSQVVDTLDRQDATVRGHLAVNLSAWDDTRTRLRQRAAHHAEGRLDFVPAGLTDSFRQPMDAPDLELAVRAELCLWSRGGAVTALRCDREDTIEGLGEGEQDFLEIPAEQCLGRNAESIFAFARVRLGPGVRVLRWEVSDTRLDRVLAFTSPRQTTRFVRMVILPRWQAGELRGSTTLATLARELPDES